MRGWLYPCLLICLIRSVSAGTNSGCTNNANLNSGTTSGGQLLYLSGFDPGTALKSLCFAWNVLPWYCLWCFAWNVKFQGNVSMHVAISMNPFYALMRFTLFHTCDTWCQTHWFIYYWHVQIHFDVLGIRGLTGTEIHIVDRKTNQYAGSRMFVTTVSM